MEEQTFHVRPVTGAKKAVVFCGLALFFGIGVSLIVTGGPPGAKASMDPHLLGAIFAGAAVLFGAYGVYSWKNPPSVTIAADHVRFVRFLSAFSPAEERFSPAEIAVSDIERKSTRPGRGGVTYRVFHIDLQRGGVLLVHYPLWELTWDLDPLHAALREFQARGAG